MPLVEHLRELRSRLIKAVIAIVLGAVVGWYLYEWLFDLLTDPYFDGIAPVIEAQGIDVNLTFTGVAGAFAFRLKVALIAGLIIASPLWIWQFWAFVLPALHTRERRWVLVLTAVCGPLFLGGVALAYYVLPRAISFLIGFTPESVLVLTSLDDYLNFIVQVMVVFGIGAQLPAVVVMLRWIGAVDRKQLARWRPWTITGIFVFAAVATPTGDPFTMLALALPMTLLYLGAELLSLLFDRRKRRTVPGP